MIKLDMHIYSNSNHAAAFDPDPIDYDMIDGGARIKQNKARAGIKILPSIEMNGGVTFSELIDFLNLKTDGNFFVGAELGAVKLPDIKMQNVSAFDVIDLMSSTLNIPVTIRWISSGEQGSKDIRWVKKDAVPQPDKNAGAAPITKKMRVYNLRGMEIDGEKDLDKMMKALSDVLLNGVRNPRYWERNVGENPSLELHKATKLLFVTAREDDFDILDQIITALGGKTAEGTVATPASETVKEKQ